MTGTLAVEHPRDLDDAESLLWEWIGRVDRACNRFNRDSEVSFLNARAGETVDLSPTLEAALVAALEAARLSDGLCDPTVLPALEALGYDRDYDELAAHGAPAPSAPVPAPGVAAIDLDLVGHRVTLAPGCRIDLGASAKAFLADRVVAELASRGGALVEVGGDVAALGSGPEGDWVVGVSDSLVITGHEPRVALRDGGLATSSSTVRSWLAGGRRVNHLVDPRTGAPAEGPYATASVASSSCVAANAYATAALLWGEEAPYHLAQAGCSARLVRRDGTVELVGAWPRDEEVR
jgi:thiamine biosynthesis lipoprotein